MINAITSLFDGFIKLLVHPRLLRKVVWPISKIEREQASVSKNVTFSPNSAFGTSTRECVFDDNRNLFGMTTNEYSLLKTEDSRDKTNIDQTPDNKIRSR